jgi:hypothetical protein
MDRMYDTDPPIEEPWEAPESWADAWPDEPSDAYADHRVLDEDYWKVADFEQLFGADR